MKNDQIKQVGNSNEAIADAKPGDFIIRNDGTKVELKQGDIEYAKSQITSQSTSTSQQTTPPVSQNPTTNTYQTPQTNPTSSNTPQSNVFNYDDLIQVTDGSEIQEFLNNDASCDAAKIAEEKGKKLLNKKKKSVWDNHTTATCPYDFNVKPRLFNQHQLTKEYGFYDNGTQRFEDTACNTTASLNIVSTQYTLETGKQLPFDDGIEAIHFATKEDSRAKKMLNKNSFIDDKDATVNDLAPAMNKMIDYIEQKHNDTNIFKGYFAYSSSTWLNDFYDINCEDYKKTNTYKIDINKGVTVSKHFTNDLGPCIIPGSRVIFDTYDGNIKIKKIIGSNSVNYYEP